MNHHQTPPRPRHGTVTIDGDYATIEFHRVLHHARELVWDAITNPTELRQWMMMSIVRIDGRVGGTIETKAGPAQLHTTGKILQWEPPKLFEYEWNLDPVKEIPTGEHAIFRWELTTEGESTLLKVTYRRITKQTALGFAPGTHVFLDRLEAQLDKQQLPDWMSRFKEIQSIYPGWSR